MVKMEEKKEKKQRKKENQHHRFYIYTYFFESRKMCVVVNINDKEVVYPWSVSVFEDKHNVI